AWMAFYCITMLAMAMELASEDPAYEDVASKFFEHFMAIVEAMNHLGGNGLWDEEDGFYYDQLRVGGRSIPLRTRSMVGLIPLFACEILEQEVMDRLPGFSKRTEWYLRNRPDITDSISCMHCVPGEEHGHRLLALPTREKLVRLLRYVLDENEFLSPFGIRSLSQFHRDHPYEFRANGELFRVDYTPGESTSGLFGGNSNWRGPIWFPLNYLLVEALERYHHFFGDDLKVECPTGSGKLMNLDQVAKEIARRLGSIFLPDSMGRRPVHGAVDRYATATDFRDLVLFYEYFHGDTGRGVGASHQTGWTALAVRLLEDGARSRETAGRVRASEKDEALERV
ncbi:MAG TPA: glucosidase, partial [Vicinamibacteria bacterium]|nr:glucosidase [Vicinamibacteria bacterium]